MPYSSAQRAESPARFGSIGSSGTLGILNVLASLNTRQIVHPVVTFLFLTDSILRSGFEALPRAEPFSHGSQEIAFTILSMVEYSIDTHFGLALTGCRGLSSIFLSIEQAAAIVFGQHSSRHHFGDQGSLLN